MNKRIGAIVLATAAITVGSTLSAEAVTVKPNTDTVLTNATTSTVNNKTATSLQYRVNTKKERLEKIPWDCTTVYSFARIPVHRAYGEIWYYRDIRTKRITRWLKVSITKTNMYNRPEAHIDIAPIGKGGWWGWKWWGFSHQGWPAPDYYWLACTGSFK